jgi:uncharacterized protein (TIGR03435 family)
MRSVLALLAVLAAAAPGQTYEVASVKPNLSGSTSSRTNGTAGQVVFTNVPLKALIVNAFGVTAFQVTGPGWLESARFDLAAKYPPGAKPADRPLMLRHFLEERFGLAAHQETKETPGYALVVAKGGFKLQPAPGPDRSVSNNSDGKRHTMTATGISMPTLADMLARQFVTPVVDRTGIEGVYNFELKWSDDDAGATADPDAPPSIFTALQEKLGLRLQSQKVPVPMVVVDRIERTPREN